MAGQYGFGRGGLFGEFPGGGSLPTDGEVLYWDTTTNKALGSPDFIFNDTLKQLVLGAGSQLLLPDGSAAVPSMAFSAQPGTGLFRPDAHRLSIALAGLEYHRFGANHDLLGGLSFHYGSSVFSPSTDITQVAAGQLLVTGGGATNTSLFLKAMATQATNLQEWQNSSGTALLRISAAGIIDSPGNIYVQAAAASSIDFRINGNSKFNINNNRVEVIADQLLLPIGTVATPSLSIGNATTGFYNPGTDIRASITGGNPFTISSSGFIGMNASQILGWSATANAYDTPDTRLYRDAAGVLAQRNGANAQAFKVSNTYTDASNNEEMYLGWITNNFFLQTRAAGTGTQRSIYLDAANVNFRYAGADVCYVTSSGIFPSSDGTKYLGTNGVRWISGWFGGNAGVVPLVVKAHASQTANLQEWQNSSGTAIASVTKDGFFVTDILRTNVIRDTNENNWLRTQVISAGAANLFIGNAGYPAQTIEMGGQVLLPNGTAVAPALSFTNSPNMGLYQSASNLMRWSSASTAAMEFGPTYLWLMNNAAQITLGAGFDLTLTRDAAGVLAQRNGANPQEFRLYNTYTDASNYARGVFKMESDALMIRSEDLGAEAGRNSDIAIYAKGGTGIYFGVGATQNCFYWDANSHNSYTDATRDLGQAARRWRAGYFGGNDGVVPLVAKAHASQTANLQEWQNSSGTPIAYVTKDGYVVGSELKTWQNANSAFIIADRTDVSEQMTMYSDNSIFNFNSSNYGTAVQIDKAKLRLTAIAAGYTPLFVKGAASQTANLQEWRKSDDTVYSRVKSDGRWRHDGATTWDDLRVDLITSTLGTLNPPVLTKVTDNGAGSEGVWAYAFNDAGTSGNEKAALFTVQLPHTWKEGTTIKPHIHWAPSTAAAGNVKWGLEYTIQDINGGAFPTTTIITGTAQSTGSTANSHLVQGLGDISMAGRKISSVLICRIFRNSSDASDTYTADVYGLFVDFHYEVDAFGSDAEFTKD